MNIEIEGKGKQAMELFLEYKELKDRAIKFVGESNGDYDKPPWNALSILASDAVLEAAINSQD